MQTHQRRISIKAEYLYILILLWVWGTIPVMMYGQQSKTGEAAFSTLEIGFGARSAAMGNAMCGLADDINTLWWNPGGLGQLKLSEISCSYHAWFQDWKDTYGSAGINTAVGVVGIGFLYSEVTGIEGYSGYNLPIGSYKTYESVLSLAYGREVMEDLYFGLSFMGLYVNLDPAMLGLESDKGKAIATNWGLLWKPGSRIGLGVCAQNLGSKVSYYYNASDYLPRALKMGINLCPIDRLNTSLEATIPQFGENNFGVGTEYWLTDIFASIGIALRGGYKILGSESGKYFGIADKLSAGFGIRYKSPFGELELDYAYAPCWDLGMIHRMTVGWIFGQPSALKAGNVIVKIIDAETKKPLQAIAILKSPQRSDTVLTSPENGEREIGSVPIGFVTVRAQKDFFTTKEDTLFLSEYETKKIELAIRYVGPQGVPHERVVKGIFGRVTGSDTKLPINSTVIYKGPQSGTINTDTSGWYAISKIPPGNYTLTFESNSHNYFPQIIENVIVEKDEAVLAHSSLTKVKVMRMYFERDRAYVHPNDYPVLDTLATFIQRYKENTFEIDGHTDPRPTVKFKNNKELSYVRANAIKEYLVSKGVAKERLSVQGFGYDKPVASNDTEEGMAFNRRIEVIMNPTNQPQETPQNLPQTKPKPKAKVKKSTTKQKDKK